MPNLWGIFLVFLLSTSLTAQSDPFASVGEKRANALLAGMSEDEKIGQLFMVAAYSNRDENHAVEIEKLIHDYHIGGLIFFQGTPDKQAELTNRFQSVSKIPLLIGQDAEWGLGMRLTGVKDFPKQMTLGAIRDNQMVNKLGAEVARQCNRLGVHVNFAPVIDINSNPANPVIGFRSFGENKENVTAKGLAYMKGLQTNRVMACGKHFPGHGDTDTDSHYTLPVIKHDKNRLDSIELYPFKQLFNNGLTSVMNAHLKIPAYDAAEGGTSSLSRNIVTDLLQEKLGFKGLIFTDALNMKAVSSRFNSGELELSAFTAGNDVLLFPEDIPKAVQAIKSALKAGFITLGQLDQRVRKILKAKHWSGALDFKPVKTEGHLEDFHRANAQKLMQELYEQSVTVVVDKNNLLPIGSTDTLDFASVSIDGGEEFRNMLDNYGRFNHYNIEQKNLVGPDPFSGLLNKLEKKKLVVVGLFGMNNNPQKNYGLNQKVIDFINNLNAKTNTVTVVFGSPYALKFIENANHLICAYEDNEHTQRIVPQVIFGGLGASGKLPVSASDKLPEGTGINKKPLNKLSYGLPEQVGMSNKALQYIDSAALKAIADSATPGCRVLIARRGKVIFNKSYGWQTYDKKISVKENTIYDLASLTKVLGTMQAVMFLAERDLIDVNKKASDYLPELLLTNKKNMTIRDILTHQAGLTPWLPHWVKTIDDNDKFIDSYYCDVAGGNFTLPVAAGLYAVNDMENIIWNWTINSDLIKKNGREYGYKYSDLGLYIMKRIAEKLLNQPIEEFLEQNFYRPLGTAALTYNPLSKFPKECIAPTENDVFFRKQLIHGTVHDQGAAMLGGVGGHAGLFGTANDLAVLMQMNMHDGAYGGHRYFQEGTVGKFTAKQSPGNRRGLGWDKPAGKGGPTSSLASSLTFGHTGFTGTAVWADPKYDLVYVFLSNRIYPSAENKKLITEGTRTEIQRVIYQSIVK